MSYASGRFFEDFRLGEVIQHATPRTLTEADNALYTALTGDRHPLFCYAELAKALGYRSGLIHEMVVFHTVFGKTVPDISLNAVANLGYADVRFLLPVYPGDTLRAQTEIVGLRESSKGSSGIVYCHTKGYNQKEETVLSFYRWVLVQKKDASKPTRCNQVPDLPKRVDPSTLRFDPFPKLGPDVAKATGQRRGYESYKKGDRIYHMDGMTIEEAEHMMATKLYQNTARVHFNALQMKASRFGKRLVYGGHVISLARALSYNGMENALMFLAWNGGTHANPVFAGDTIYAFSDVLDVVPMGHDAAALNIRMIAVKNSDPAQEAFEIQVSGDGGKKSYHPSVVLDLDAWVLMPSEQVLSSP